VITRLTRATTPAGAHSQTLDRAAPADRLEIDPDTSADLRVALFERSSELRHRQRWSSMVQSTTTVIGTVGAGSSQEKPLPVEQTP
jgi:hypothetical protein